MGDGGFGITDYQRLGNAVFNKHDGVIVVVDNYYRRDRDQGIASSRADNRLCFDEYSIVEPSKASAPNGCARSTAPTASGACAIRCVAPTTEEKGRRDDCRLSERMPTNNGV